MQDYPVFRPERYQGLGMPLASQRLGRQRSLSRSPSPVAAVASVASVPKSPFQPNAPLVNSQPFPKNQVIGPPIVYAQRPETVSRIEQRVKGQLIKGDSRIQYVPVQKKVVDYVDEPRYEVVPKKKMITDYREFKKVDIVPREVTKTDYYAIEHIRTYVPQVKVERYTDYVPVQYKNLSLQYIPIQRQLIHYPQRQHEEQCSRYLGVRQPSGPKTYENVNQQDIKVWEREYGYVRGEPMSVLNQKIKKKAQLEIEDYYRQCRKQFESKSTMAGSQYVPGGSQYSNAPISPPPPPQAPLQMHSQMHTQPRPIFPPQAQSRIAGPPRPMY